MAEEKPVLMRRGDARYTWDDAVAAVGKDFSGGGGGGGGGGGIMSGRRP